MAFYYVKLDSNNMIISATTLLNEINSVITSREKIYSVPHVIYEAYMNNNDVYSFRLNINTGEVEQIIKMDEVKSRLEDLIGTLTQQRIFTGFISNNREYKCDLVTQQNITRYYTMKDLMGSSSSPGSSVEIKTKTGDIIKMDKSDIRLLFRDMNKHIDKCLKESRDAKKQVSAIAGKKEADEFRQKIVEKFKTRP